MATPTPCSAASAPSPSGSVSHTPIDETTPIDADTAAASISSDEETAPADPLTGVNVLIDWNRFGCEKCCMGKGQISMFM
ncbi:hypothetical protein IFM89_009318 [Coptis chinensis]|uniref:Uncharacterized protein n=1 Tax=Coptis chinensis TaxID=261450 RepID=A0A835MDJ3_9MAGN|nr:hypothetical protein IFM89_009318 [Coptis chinensis]